jgi:hypothetical protein
MKGTGKFPIQKCAIFRKFKEIKELRGGIEIRVGGCNAVDGPKDKQDVELFLSGAP